MLVFFVGGILLLFVSQDHKSTLGLYADVGEIA